MVLETKSCTLGWRLEKADMAKQAVADLRLGPKGGEPARSQLLRMP